MPIERLQWSLPDPAAGQASFETVYQELGARVRKLLAGAALS